MAFPCKKRHPSPGAGGSVPAEEIRVKVKVQRGLWLQLRTKLSPAQDCTFLWICSLTFWTKPVTAGSCGDFRSTLNTSGFFTVTGKRWEKKWNVVYVHNPQGTRTPWVTIGCKWELQSSSYPWSQTSLWWLMIQNHFSPPLCWHCH